MSTPRGSSRGRGGPGDRGGHGGHGDSPRGRGGGSRPPGGYQQRPQTGGRPPREPEAPVDVMFPRPPTVDSQVAKLENNASAHNQTQPHKSGKLECRPDYGSNGENIQMRSNYFHLSLGKDVKYHCYHVEFEPKAEPPKVLKELTTELLKQERMTKAHAMSDFDHAIVSLSSIDMTDISLNIWHERQDKKGHNAPSGHMYKCKFKQGPVIDHAKIIASLRDPKSPYPIENENILIRCLNIMMTAYPFHRRDKIQTVGKGTKKFFRLDHEEDYAPLNGGLVCGRGFFSSVRLAAGWAVLNLNVCHNAMYRAGPAINLTDEYVRMFGMDRSGFNSFVKGLHVEVTHLGKEKIDGQWRYPRKYVWGCATPNDSGGKSTRAERIASSPANVSFLQFDPSDTGRKRGTWVTVAHYFQTKYHMRNLSERPVFNVGSHDRPQYVPQEVVNVLPAQPYNGELSTEQRQNIITFSCRRPPNNYKSIMDVGREVMGIIGQQTERSGFHVDQEMIVVPARILPAPSIQYGKRTAKITNGAWNLRGESFSKPVTLESKWGYFMVGRPFNTDELHTRYKTYTDAFSNKLRELGLRMSKATGPHSINISPTSWREDIEGFLIRAKKENYKFLVIILEGLDDKQFCHLKWQADVRIGILNHCCRGDKLHSKPEANHQYLANNAMKINLKLGGTCQTLEVLPKILASGKTMIIGLDVTHPPPGSQKTVPSMASIVASISKDLGQWPGSVVAVGNKEEIVDTHIKDMVVGRLKRWRAVNNFLPTNIIIFRDGVSEGQYGKVTGDELPSIRDAFTECYGSAQHPNLSLILVTKRHHTRFFPTRKNDCDGNNGPKNGTVVDRGVTRPASWDFYLQAQSPLQGSARPAHYVVLYDDIFTNKMINPGGKPSDTVQALAHQICYLMGRCTRSISYATPAFLADRLCDRAAKFVKAYASEEREKPGRSKIVGATDADQDRSKYSLHDDVANYMVYI